MSSDDLSIEQKLSLINQRVNFLAQSVTIIQGRLEHEQAERFKIIDKINMLEQRVKEYMNNEQ